MAPDPTDRPTLDPDDIAKRSFERTRKGYEVDEVRAYLVGLASQVREANRLHADLERRLVEVERRAADITELDVDAVTKMLGEETARVLETARKASAEIRAKAEEKALATVAEAAEKATATREAADQYAQGVRGSADEVVATQRAEAEAYAQDVRSRADEDTAALRAEADEYARTVRERADTEVAELRAAAEDETGRLRSEAESVLAERTGEAEEAAAAIRADADSYRAQVHEEADAYAESTRAEADTYQADLRGQADADRTAAREEAAQLLADTKASADELRQQADAHAAGSREAAEVEAERIVDEAREQGRSMVQEARTYRERVIVDLAERRRAARAELEQLATARDALAVTLTDVKARIETSHRALEEVVLDPREVGDPAVDRRALESSDRPATSLAVGELDGGPAEGDAEAHGPSEGGVTEGAAAGGGEEPAGSGEDAGGIGADEDEHAGEVAVVASVDPISGIVSIDAPGAGRSGEAPAPSEADAPAAAEDTGASEPSDTEEDEGAHDQGAAIFAKLRAGRSRGTGRAARRAAKGGVAVAEPGERTEASPAVEGTDPVVAAAGPARAAEAEAETGEADPGDPTGTGDDGPAGAGDAGGSEEDAPAAEGSADADETGEQPAAEEQADEPGADAPAADETAADEQAGEDEVDPEAVVDPDQDLLDRRDAATDEVERQLARRLKRVLSDEQNESLDLLRRAKGKGTAAEVLPDLEAHHARYRDAALEDLRTAERAGASFFGPAPKRTADVADVAAEFADELVRQIRGRLERAFSEGQGDEQEVGERIRACYREWKTQRIADTARHFVVAAFSRGVTEAAPDGTSFRWLVDDGGAPCPDCDDNALAGGVGKGEPFPTGDLCPPAHPGCRCVTVPVDT